MYKGILGLPSSPEEEAAHAEIIAAEYRASAAQFAIALANTAGDDRFGLGLTVQSYREQAASIERESMGIPDLEQPDYRRNAHHSPGFYS